MPALSGGNVTLWRTGKPYSSRLYAFILKPTVVFQARINMATVTYPLTSLTFDTVTTGAYTDIEPGMTLFLGSSAGDYDNGRVRVRGTASSSAIPINRTSRGERFGELNITDNDYITVVDLREVWTKTPFISTTGVSRKDETSFGASIAQPPIANGGPAVADFVDDDDVLIRNFTAANSRVVDPGASSLTYSWDFKDATPPSSTSQTPSGIEFPPGFRYVDLTVSDGTRTHTTHIPVYAAETSGENAPIPVTQVRRTLRPEGQSVTVTVRSADIDITDYPPGTLMILFERERYGTAHTGSLAGTSGRENVKFVGWLDDESTRINAGEDGLAKSVTLTALDVTGKLAQRPGFSNILTTKPTPVNWQQMKSANIDRYFHYLLHWHSTALEVAPFTWSGEGATYVFKTLESDQGKLYEQVDKLAKAIAHRFTCNERGEMMIRPDPQRLASVDRTNVEIITLTEDDWSAGSYSEQITPQVYWLEGSAIIASSTQVKTAFCISPGSSPGQGESSQSANYNLVASANELYTRIGHDYARLNANRSVLNITLTNKGDAGIEPAFMEWVEFSISANVAAQRGVTIAEGTRFLVMETSVEYDEETATKNVSIQIEQEVIGTAAQKVNPPSSGSRTVKIPSMPVTPSYAFLPPAPEILYPPTYMPVITDPFGTNPVLRDGNAVMIWTDDNRLLASQTFKRTNNPTWLDSTPNGLNGDIQHVKLGYGTETYLLECDGENSWVWYTKNPWSDDVAWTMSEEIGGIYTHIDPTSTAGSVYLYGRSEGESSDVSIFDFVNDGDGGWTRALVSGFNNGVHVDTVGWQHTDAVNGGPTYRAVVIQITFPSSSISEIETVVDYTRGTSGISAGNTAWQIRVDSTILGSIQVALFPTPVTSYHREWIGSITGTSVIVFLVCDIDGTVPIAPTGQAIFREVRIHWDGPNPFAATVNTRLSTDFGATWSAPESVSNDFSVGGFDTIKTGIQSLAAAANQVYIAETPGGDYAAYGDPVPTGAIPTALLLPRYQFGSSSSLNVSTNTPQYLVASALLTASNESMWKVTNGGATFTNITPLISGDYFEAIGRNCIDMPIRNGNKIAAIGLFDTDRKLVTTANAGGSWSDRGDLSDDANYISMRKGDLNALELYMTDGEVLQYSPDFGATLIEKSFEGSDSSIAIGIEVYG